MTDPDLRADLTDYIDELAASPTEELLASQVADELRHILRKVDDPGNLDALADDYRGGAA